MPLEIHMYVHMFYVYILILNENTEYNNMIHCLIYVLVTFSQYSNHKYKPLDIIFKISQINKFQYNSNINIINLNIIINII